ncbi:MAG: hypothetical protein ABW178_00945, partial [Pseudoxanthomonas sp.]
VPAAEHRAASGAVGLHQDAEHVAVQQDLSGTEAANASAGQALKLRKRVPLLVMPVAEATPVAQVVRTNKMFLKKNLRNGSRLSATGRYSYQQRHRSPERPPCGTPA